MKERSWMSAALEQNANDKGYVSMADLLSNVSVKGNEMTLKLDDFEPVAEVCPSKDGSGIIGVDWNSANTPRLMFGDKLYTASQMQQLIDQINAKDADLATARAEIEWIKSQQEWLIDINAINSEKSNKQLAARDLVIQQKDTALRHIAERSVKANTSIYTLERLANEALAIQPATEALAAYVAEAVAAEREWIELAFEAHPNLDIDVETIRARKDKP